VTTQTTRAGVGVSGSRPRLLWTEYWYLVAVAIAAAVTVDPLEWGLAADRLLKHLAFAISLLALALTLTARKLHSPWQRSGHLAKALRAAWPLAALAALVLAGSLYARLVAGIQNTFLNVGLYMLMTFVAATMVQQSRAPDALLRGYFRILLAAAVVMGAWLVWNFRVRQVYHEQIFLVIPLAALLLVPADRTLVRWLGGAFLLSMTWFSQKYTSFLIGAVTVLYLGGAVALPRLGARSGLYRATVVYWSLLLGGLVAGLLVVVALLWPAELPTGNVEYRWHTYGEAWGRFVASPLWGTLFADEAVEKFSLYTIGIAGNVLPTHSDFLDLLAHGGVTAAVLLLAGLAGIARIAAKTVLAPRYLGQPWAAYAHTAALVSLAGALTSAFNPILLQPSMAYLWWSTLGLLLGLSLRVGAEPSSEPTRATPEGDRHARRAVHA